MRQSIRLALGLGFGFASILAHGNGYHFLHQSAEGFGTAYAANGTAINDISAMFSNPASITRFDGLNLSGGLALDFPRSKFENLVATAPFTGAPVTGNPAAPSQPIDTAFGGASYGSYQINDRLYFGMALGAPYAYVSEYPSTAPSRYHATLTELFAYNASPTLAWKVDDKLSVAAGINMQMYRNKVYTMISTDPAAPAPATDVESRISASDLSVGFSLGMEYQLSDNTRVGASYRSRIGHNFNGDSEFLGSQDNLQALLDAVPDMTGLQSSARFSIATPSMLQVGVLHKLSDKWELYGNANYFGWSAFKDTHIRFDNNFPDVVVDNDWKNSLFLAGGLGYQWKEKIKLRAGAAYDWSPTPAKGVNPRAPNNNRMYAAFGLSYQPSEEWKFDAGYLFILFKEVHVNLAGGNNQPRGTLRGDLNLYANVFMFQINRTFK